MCKNGNSGFLKCERKYLLSLTWGKIIKYLLKYLIVFIQNHQEFKGFKCGEICNHFNFQRENKGQSNV